MIPRNVIICLTVLATIGFFILGIVLTSFSIASYSDCSGKDYIPTTVYQCVNNKYGNYCASAYKPCIFNNGTNIITNCSDFCDGCLIVIKVRLIIIVIVLIFKQTIQF